MYGVAMSWVTVFATAAIGFEDVTAKDLELLGGGCPPAEVTADFHNAAQKNSAVRPMRVRN